MAKPFEWGTFGQIISDRDVYMEQLKFGPAVRQKITELLPLTEEPRRNLLGVYQIIRSIAHDDNSSKQAQDSDWAARNEETNVEERNSTEKH